MPQPNRWEAFARKDAELYILGRSVGGDDEAAERFFQSGRDTAAWMLDQVDDDLPGRDLGLEVGCGVGRLLIPMAASFARVIGVDVAPTMLEKLQANCRRFGVDNVEPMLADAPWDEPRRADLAYSWLVFQHLEHFELIASLVRRLARALKAEGVALLQFDTRPASALYRLRNALPDVLRPRPWRRGICRVRRSPRQLDDLFAATGLALLREEGAGTDVHVIVLRNTRR